MRNSSILKWANNKNSGSSKLGGGAKNGEKKWIHSPDTLVQGHVVYLVKFLGSTEVDQPKGIEVVKQGIQRLKFNQQLKKSESGQKDNKTPKVELTISVDGVTIQEPKTKNLLHRYPLHRISYCADDKAEKRFFSFIAKEGSTSESGCEHTCFVFVSDKLAEEITLTIGQAFELAYKKFLDTSGKELESRKQLLVLQKRTQALEAENAELRRRLRDLAGIKGARDGVREYMRKHKITDITEVKQQQQEQQQQQHQMSKTTSVPSKLAEKQQKEEKEKSTTLPPSSTSTSAAADELICLDTTSSAVVISSSSSSGVDGLTLDDLNDDDFNPRAEGNGNNEEEDDDDEVGESDDFDPRRHEEEEEELPPPQIKAPALPQIMAPPAPALSKNPPTSSSGATTAISSGDIFSRKDDPFGGSDPFGMSAFSSDATKVGNSVFSDNFAVGVSVGGGVGKQQADAGAFSCFEDLDPLKK